LLYWYTHCPRNDIAAVKMFKQRHIQQNDNDDRDDDDMYNRESSKIFQTDEKLSIRGVVNLPHHQWSLAAALESQ